ncbi:hypothetical protein Egran_04507 [Elaphomyces granulatus]|uniref:Nuclear membrane fusion protein Kar5 n=1 Tax=Elaphomyces granulatus TaxID=519963 RepID=A0A232LV64_9EURO|nr:hypothetical protein Egran_04507 [Elaphomyces granulatus]
MKILCVFIQFSTCSALLGIPPDSVYSTTREAPSLFNSSSEGLDLVTVLNLKALQQDSIFSEAIQLLDSMKSASSCNRIAATRLLTSCQSIDNNADTAKEDSMTLDQVKSLYAARLAICELTGAGATIPPTCSTLYITQERLQDPDRSAKQDNLGSEALDSSVPTMLHSCLKSLESRPQWWTSYSNSRQNAVVICQAARIELEKEELLNLHRSLTTNTAKLNKALQDTLQSTATQSTKHRAFVEAVDVLGVNLFRELEENNSKARTLFSSFIYEIENAIGSTASNIASMIMSAGVDTETLTKVWECRHVQGLDSDLKQEIRNATSEVNNLQCNIRAVYEESISQHAELLEVQRRDSRTNRDLALAVQSSLDSLLMQDMARLSERVNSMDGALEWLAQRFTLIHRQEETFLERLQKFETSLSETEITADGVHKSQLLQAEALKAQSKAQETLRSNVKVAQALLDRLSSKAANIEVVLDETTQRLKELPAVGGVLAMRFPWVLSILFFCIIAVQNPRAAAMILLSGILLLSTSFLI